MKIVVKGKIKVPSGVNAKTACTGTVNMTIKKGKTLLTARNAKLSKKCAFTKTISLSKSKVGSAKTPEDHRALPGQLDPQADDQEPVGHDQALKD